MSVCFHRLWQEELNKLENQTKKFSKCEAVKKKKDFLCSLESLPMVL